MEMLKYSLNNQKEASLTCVMVLLPQAVANTNNTGFTSIVSVKGATIPAAVIADTTPCTSHNTNDRCN